MPWFYAGIMNIQTAIADGVLTITIARPEKKNALTLAMYQAMSDAIHQGRADATVRALLITGQAGVFTSGNDLQDFLERTPDGEASPVFRFMDAMLGCEKPIIAAVTGPAIGIGTTMLLHCDLVYVADDARLGTPFVNLGLVPEFASSLLLPRLMGYAQAAEKLLLGDMFSGTEAVRLGLANAALPASEVLDHARAVAHRFTSLPFAAVLASKRLLRTGLRDQIDATIKAEMAVFIERLASAETRKALQAFLEKRRSAIGRGT
jgi:enoyl-CoA hydratase/carnithine racemase